MSRPLAAGEDPLVPSTGMRSLNKKSYEEREKLKQQLFEEQHHQCALCRNPITDLKEAELDHRVPLSKGGSDDPSNLQLAHRECNRTKGAKLE